MTAPSPSEFFSRLSWLTGEPLMSVVEPYRQRLFDAALYSFDGESGSKLESGPIQESGHKSDFRPRFNLVLSGRGKKNWKSADLILAALYRFLVWPSVLGNDCLLLANDADQAADDLTIAKRLIECNPILGADIIVQQRRLVRRDGRGVMEILPAGDLSGSHGKTFLFIGFDEIHGYRNWDLFEALAPDPTRSDCLIWITSYASIYNSPGAPLHDLIEIGKSGDDPRMLFSWYSSSFTTDAEFEDADAEQRANPSMDGWPEGRAYLAQQRRRLPAHKYRRLHLNEPGLPDGAAMPADLVMDAIVAGRDHLKPKDGVQYYAYVDMSGGASDDATLGIAHIHHERGVIVDHVLDQGQRPPFDPRRAVQRFARVCHQFRCSRVTGDSYAGQTFAHAFEDEDVLFEVSPWTKHALYENLEIALTTGGLELPDRPQLREQLLGLVWRGQKIDHAPGAHDDWANAAAGAIQLAGGGIWAPPPEAFEIFADAPVTSQLRDLAAQGLTPAEARLETVQPTPPWLRRRGGNPPFIFVS